MVTSGGLKPRAASQSHSCPRDSGSGGLQTKRVARIAVAALEAVLGAVLAHEYKLPPPGGLVACRRTARKHEPRIGGARERQRR